MKKMLSIRTVIAGAMLLPVLMMPVSVSADDASRLVTIGPGVTELVYALEQGGRIIGTDASSNIPEITRSLPKVGYHRQLSAEGLLSLKLDHIIGTEDMGSPIVIQQLKRAGISVTTLPGGYGVEGLQQRIQQLSSVFGDTAAGDKLWQSIDADFVAARIMADAALSNEAKPQKVIYLMAHSGTPVLAGNSTTANTLIELAGGVNPVKNSFSGYKPVSAESLLLMAPDVIIVGESTLSKEGSVKSVLRLIPGLESTPAGRHLNVLTIDDTTLMGGLGPRIGQITLKLTEQIYTFKAKRNVAKTNG